MENDADAAALAEAEWGAGRGAGRFLYVTVGTGIGVSYYLYSLSYESTDDAFIDGHIVPVSARSARSFTRMSHQPARHRGKVKSIAL